MKQRGKRKSTSDAGDRESGASASASNPHFVKIPEYPLYCDFGCEYASFGDPSAVGACRRDIGVWCALAKRHNNKHARCLMR